MKREGMDSMAQATDTRQKQVGRNASVDFIRGLAILMVVLGHTMSGCTINSQDTFLFRVIWSLQMPLFMLISGYVTRYSRRINSTKMLGNVIIKRTLSYLGPWVVWTFGVRGILLGETNYLDIPWLLWHMDTGYWFLFSLWTITIISVISQWLTGLFHCKYGSIQHMVTLVVVYGAGAAFLLILGMWQGLSFLCIKLTLYYVPFYLAGFLFGVYQEQILGKKDGGKWIEKVVAICGIAWLYLVLRFNFYSLDDDFATISLRMISSLMGCITVAGLCVSLPKNCGGGCSSLANIPWKCM